MAESVRFGRYTLVKRIAAGGMAEIYLAKQQGPGTFERSLVIKRMLPHLTDDPKFVQMFLDEAALAAQLNHPHIAQVIDFGQEDDSYFIALELIRGPDLRLLNLAVKKIGQFVPTEVAMKMVSQTCQALDYAHRAVGQDGQPLNIVHRDVSPQNVLVSYDGVVKLVDFGIAKASSSGSNTEAGVVKGKFAYLSPEQTRAQKLDGRSDLYAAGLVLFELLTGEQGLQGDGPAAIANAMDANVAPITNYRTDLPEDLLAVLHQALSKSREDRQSSCLEFANQLDDLLTQWGVSVGQPELAAYVRELEVNVGEPLSAAARTGSFVPGAELPPPGTGPGTRRSQVRPAVPEAAEPAMGNEPTMMPVRKTGTRGAVSAPEARGRSSSGEQREMVSNRSTGLRKAIEPDPAPANPARGRSGARGGFADPDATMPPRGRSASRRAVQEEEPPPDEATDEGHDGETEDPQANEVTPVPQPRAKAPPARSRAREVTPVSTKPARPARVVEEEESDEAESEAEESQEEEAPPPAKAKRQPEPEKKEKSGGGFFTSLFTFLLFVGVLGGGGYGVWYKTLGPGKPAEPPPISTEIPHAPAPPKPPPANLLAGQAPVGAAGAEAPAGSPAPTGPTAPTGATSNKVPAAVDAVAGDEKKHTHKKVEGTVAKADGPPEGQAGLVVDADPPCEVLVDDQAVGPTPLKTGLAPGAHVVKVRNAKLKLERVLPLTLEAGAWSKQSVTFQKGTVRIKAIPWANVVFGGKDLHQTPVHPQEVYEGSYDVVFTNSGKTQTKTVVVKGGDDQEVAADFSQ